MTNFSYFKQLELKASSAWCGLADIITDSKTLLTETERNKIREVMDILDNLELHCSKVNRKKEGGE